MSGKRFCTEEVLANIMADEDNANFKKTDDEIEEFERLADATDAIIDSQTQVDVVLLPPTKVDSISDEEMIDDDDLLPSNLPNEVPGMRKKDRGYYDACCDENVIAVKWNDNQCVRVSNYDKILGKARRWSSAKKSSVDLPQPALVKRYNTHMGGVDLLDRFMAADRPMLRS